MATFWRVIAVLLALASFSAFASVPTSPVYTWTGEGRPEVTFSSPDATCADQIAYRNSLGTVGFVWEFYSVYQVNATFAYCNASKRWGDGSLSEGAASWSMGATVANVCPANSTASGGACSCNSGYVENSDSTSCLPETPPPPECTAPQVLIEGTCQTPPPPECEIPLGSVVSSSTAQMTSSGYTGGMMCMQHCVSYPTFAGKSAETGKWYANGPWTSAGVTCTGSSTGGGSTGTGSTGGPPGNTDPEAAGDDPPAPDDPDPPPTCGAGQCPGTVNGTAVCVACSSGATPGSGSGSGNSETGTTNPDGSPTEGGSGSGDGTTGTTTTGGTVCEGSSCTTTTTTTTTNPDGTTTTTDSTKTEPKEDFCTSNPKSPLCVTGSFGGACGGGFVCEGDAVQCATAQATQQTLCQLKVDPLNPVVAAGTAAMGGGQGEGHPRSSITDVGVGTLDTSNPWGSSCPSDQTVTNFMGSPIVIPLSSACSVFQMMGALLVGLSLIAGAFIVVRGT